MRDGILSIAARADGDWVVRAGLQQLSQLIRFHLPQDTDERCKTQPARDSGELRSQAVDKVVAQVSNLLYRRFPIGSMTVAPGLSGRPQAGSTAIQQVGNLRYAQVAGLCQ